MLFTCLKPTAIATETRCENYPKLTRKKPKRRQIVSFERSNTRWELVNSCLVEFKLFPKVIELCQVAK